MPLSCGEAVAGRKFLCYTERTCRKEGTRGKAFGKGAKAALEKEKTEKKE